MNLETVISALIVIIVILLVQYVIKPLMRGLKDKTWYALAVNIITVILIMVLSVLFIFIDAFLDIGVVEETIDLLIKIFAAVFVYEVGKNAKRAVGNGGQVVVE